MNIIEKAICSKWHLIAYGLGISEGSKNCIFCQKFLRYKCKNCPIYNKNKKYYKCRNTPCRKIITHTLLIDNNNMIDDVENQIIFLCSLLPKDHEWYEEYH